MAEKVTHYLWRRSCTLVWGETTSEALSEAAKVAKAVEKKYASKVASIQFEQDLNDEGDFEGCYVTLFFDHNLEDADASVSIKA